MVAAGPAPHGRRHLDAVLRDLRYRRSVAFFIAALRSLNSWSCGGKKTEERGGEREREMGEEGRERKGWAGGGKKKKLGSRDDDRLAQHL